MVPQPHDCIPLNCRRSAAQIGRNLAQRLTDDRQRIEGCMLWLRRLRQDVGGQTSRMIERQTGEMARVTQTLKV
jgi:hypothetical protein